MTARQAQHGECSESDPVERPLGLLPAPTSDVTTGISGGDLELSAMGALGLGSAS